MKRIAWSLLIVAGVGLSRLGLADVVTNYWQATDQGLGGSWGDTDHWSLGHLPSDGEVAVIDPLRTGGSSADFTITVDEAYTADSLTIGDPGNATRKQAVRFAGTGLPEAGDSYKFRTVETENGLELQCKSVTGVAIIVK